MNGSWLFWGMLFGSIGLGLLVYGKKQQAAVPMVCGLALMIFPYFTSNTVVLVVVGIVLIVVPYYART
ncbi:MAG: hypothetical protein VYE73_15600 [Acidobacteriota bacterium]|nr:hypothetical protein [Acidobacteriota bacterium]